MTTRVYRIPASRPARPQLARGKVNIFTVIVIQRYSLDAPNQDFAKYAHDGA
jgi:hypothetical protein